MANSGALAGSGAVASTQNNPNGAYGSVGGSISAGKASSGTGSLSGCCKGPFPGPKGSIYDSKPAPPGGGGPSGIVSAPVGVNKPTQVYQPAPISSSSINTVVPGSSQAIAATFPGPSGSIHSSKPAYAGGGGVAGAVASAGASSSVIPTQNQPSYGGYPSVSGSNVNTGGAPIVPGSSQAIAGSFPGPSGSIHASKPATNYAQTNLPSNYPTYGSNNVIVPSPTPANPSYSNNVNAGDVSGGFPSTSGSIHPNKPVYSQNIPYTAGSTVTAGSSAIAGASSTASSLPGQISKVPSYGSITSTIPESISSVTNTIPATISTANTIPSLPATSNSPSYENGTPLGPITSNKPIIVASSEPTAPGNYYEKPVYSDLPFYPPLGTYPPSYSLPSTVATLPSSTTTGSTSTTQTHSGAYGSVGSSNIDIGSGLHEERPSGGQITIGGGLQEGSGQTTSTTSTNQGYYGNVGCSFNPIKPGSGCNSPSGGKVTIGGGLQEGNRPLSSTASTSTITNEGNYGGVGGQITIGGLQEGSTGSYSPAAVGGSLQEGVPLLKEDLLPPLLPSTNKPSYQPISTPLNQNSYNKQPQTGIIFVNNDREDILEYPTSGEVGKPGEEIVFEDIQNAGRRNNYNPNGYATGQVTIFKPDGSISSDKPAGCQSGGCGNVGLTLGQLFIQKPDGSIAGSSSGVNSGSYGGQNTYISSFGSNPNGKEGVSAGALSSAGLLGHLYGKNGYGGAFAKSAASTSSFASASSAY